VEQLPKITARLENTRTALGLDHFFEAGQDTRDQGCKSHDHENLNQIEKDPVKHGAFLLSCRRSADAIDDRNLLPSAGCECDYSLAT
jgi:hypothetical protein